MQFITSPKKIMGLDISDLSIKVVQIERKKGKRYIHSMNSIAVTAGLIEQGIIKKPEIVAKIIKKLIARASDKITTHYASVSLPEPKTFIKVIQIPAKEIENHQILDIIKHELPRHIPINIEDVQLDWQEISNNHKYKKFLVGAVPKSIATDYLNVCHLANIKVVALEIEAQAIVRCVLPQTKLKKYNKNWLKKFKLLKIKKIKNPTAADNSPKIILDLGATRTGLIVLDNNIIQFTNTLSNISGEKITNDIIRVKKLSYKDAEKAKIVCGLNPNKCRGAVIKSIRQSIDELIKEIINADNFYQTHFGQATHNIGVILSGGGANLNNLDKVLREKIKRNVKIADPLANLETGLPKKINNLLAYTTAIGLALRNTDIY